MSTYHIACYYPWIYLRSGIERTIIEVARRSRHRWTIFTNHFDSGNTYPSFSEHDVVELQRVSVNRGYLHVARAALTILTQRILPDNYDALFIHSEGLGDLITFRNHSKPVVCYCHTPLKVVNDSWAKSQYLRKNPNKAIPFALYGKLFMAIDRLAWKNYSYVLANSETVRDRIVKANLAKKEKVEVLNPGVDCKEMTPSNKYGSYFLLVTRIKWWKNVELAIEAFKEFQRSYSMASNFKLIVAGQVDKGSIKYFRDLCDLSQPCKQIEFVPNPSIEQILELYRFCYAVLNTTLNEDWGIVPLEANAFGKPVIGVNQGGLRESQIDGETGFLLPPDPKAFSITMASLANNENSVREIGKKARKNALKYDWSIFVKRLDKVLEEVAANNYHS